MATRMQQRRGTSAEWSAANPVLADGEIGVEKDTGIIKVGNGSSPWNQLPAALGSAYLPRLGTANDSARLGGLDASEYITKGSASPNNTPGGLVYRDANGAINVTTANASKVRVSSTGDASETSTEHGFQVGDTSGLNVIIDNNELVARNNGTKAPSFGFNGSRLSSVADPVSGSDAATKSYVDTLTGGDTSWQTAALASGWSGNFTWRVKNNVFYWKCQTTRQSWSAGVAFLTLGTAYRTTRQLSGIGMFQGSVYEIVFNTNGSVLIANSGGLGVYGSGSYPLN